MLLLVEVENNSTRKYFQVVSYDVGKWSTMAGRGRRWAHSRQQEGNVAHVLLGKGAWWRTGLVGWRH